MNPEPAREPANDLDPARGIAAAVALCAPFWLLVWWLL